MKTFNQIYKNLIKHDELIYSSFFKCGNSAQKENFTFEMKMGFNYNYRIKIMSDIVSEVFNFEINYIVNGLIMKAEYKKDLPSIDKLILNFIKIRNRKEKCS